jgi:iron-sulfur cluster assembly protein
MTMLELSDSAAQFLTDARATSGLPETVGTRLSVRSDGDAQGIRVSFANRPGSDDAVIEHHGARVFVAVELSEILRDRVLDTEIEEEGERLVLRPRVPAAS